jgi:hypothetical protein
MHSVPKKILTLLALAALAPSALAFSLLGPYLTWQTPQLGYQRTNDIGGPMFFHSFYRWNVPTVYYAFDQSFINYFGTNGVKAVDDAFAVLNSLSNSAALNINNYPLDSKLWNPLAEQADLVDVKSVTLSILMEYLGLADPERFAWTLYYRAAGAVNTNYYVIQMNYDPETFQPTSQVNAVYYTYRITENNGIADAVDIPVTFNDHLPFSAVAGGHLGAGYFYTGLTRDDVGGIKYLLSTNTLAVESLLPSVAQGGPSILSSGAWVPYQGGSNTVASNYFSGSNYYTPIILAGLTNASNFFINGIRGGVNKVKFTRVEYDSLLMNTFTNTITNFYTDVVVVTNKLVAQKVYRAVTQPDIVFIADHLGFVDTVQPDGTLVTTPVMTARTGTANWINNDVLNGQTIEGGPGLITGPFAITFSSDLGGLFNSNPYYWDEQWSATGPRWASFDQTPNPPFIYPVYEQITIDQLLQYINAFTNYTPGTLVSPSSK